MDVSLPELISFEDYDYKLAKLEASLSWLLTKAHINIKNESGICIDENSSLLTPMVISGLVSGIAYHRAMCNVFPTDAKCFDQSHLSIVRWLLRQGFEVLPNEINFETLKSSEPFDQEMHLALIDKIMAAYIYRTLSVENVVKTVRRFSTFSASSELPTTIEETIVFWSNKVCRSMCDKYDSYLGPPSSKDANGTEDTAGSFYNLLAVTELEDFACGRSLACLLSYYRPNDLVFEDICFDEDAGIADSLFNLQLCAEACSRIFDTSSSSPKLLHMTITDVFYNHVHLTVNIMSLFADLFETFELNSSTAIDGRGRKGRSDKRETIQPAANSYNGELASTGEKNKEDLYKDDVQGRKIPSFVNIPEISNATKRSFQNPPPSSSSITSVKTNRIPSAPNKSLMDQSLSSSPLLPLRRVQQEEKLSCNNEKDNFPTSSSYVVKGKALYVEEGEDLQMVGDRISQSSSCGNFSLKDNISLSSSQIPSSRENIWHKYRETCPTEVSSARPATSSSRDAVSHRYAKQRSPSSISYYVPSNGNGDEIAVNGHEKNNIHSKEKNFNYQINTPSLSSVVSTHDMGSNSSSHQSLKSLISTSVDPNPKVRQGFLEKKSKETDRHVRYCSELGLIPGLSRPRKPHFVLLPDSSSGLKSTSKIAKEERSVGLADEIDEEVDAITKNIVENDNEFITPPEHFRDDFYLGWNGNGVDNDDQFVHFNNSNSSMKQKVSSSLRDLNFMKPTSTNRPIKTDWLRQIGLDGNQHFVSKPKEVKKDGTFKIRKNYGKKHESINTVMNKEENHLDNSKDLIPKTSFSLLSQHQSISGNDKKLQQTPSSTASVAFNSAISASGMDLKTSISQPTGEINSKTHSEKKMTWIESARTPPNVDGKIISDSSSGGGKSVSSKMSLLRMELIERRRQIESKKHSSDVQWTKQRQQIGKEAFIQVVSGQKSERSSTSHKNQTSFRRKLFEKDSAESSVIDDIQLSTQRSVISAPLSDEIPVEEKVRKHETKENGQQKENKFFLNIENEYDSLKSSDVCIDANNFMENKFIAEKAEKERQDSVDEKAEKKSSEMLSSEKPSDVCDDNFEEVQTIDRLKSSLSELKGEVERLSAEQDQLKGFVSNSHQAQKNADEKVRSARKKHGRDELEYSFGRRNKLGSSPMRESDFKNHHVPPFFHQSYHQNEVQLPHQSLTNSDVRGNFQEQSPPAPLYSPQLLFDSRSYPVVNSRPAYVLPVSNIFATLPGKKMQRPSSSSSENRYVNFPEYSMQSSQHAENYIGKTPATMNHVMLPNSHYYSLQSDMPVSSYFHQHAAALANVPLMSGPAQNHLTSVAFTIPSDINNGAKAKSTYDPNNFSGYFSTSGKTANSMESFRMPSSSRTVDPNFTLPHPLHSAANFSMPMPPQYTQVNMEEFDANFGHHLPPSSVGSQMGTSNKFVAKPKVDMEQSTSHQYVSTVAASNVRKQSNVDTKEHVNDQQPQIVHQQHQQPHKTTSTTDNDESRGTNRQYANQSDNSALFSDGEELPVGEFEADAEVTVIHRDRGDRISPETICIEESKSNEFGDDDEDGGEFASNKLNRESPVAFVVNQSSDQNLDIDEMEKRKQRLEEMHARRREELDMKRMRLEREAVKRKEMQRQKEEMTMQKKAEERARREAIYHTYLQKKMENLGDDESTPAGPSQGSHKGSSSQLSHQPSGSSMKRQKSARSARTNPAGKGQGTVAAMRCGSSNSRLNEISDKSNGHSSSNNNICVGDGIPQVPLTNLMRNTAVETVNIKLNLDNAISASHLLNNNVVNNEASGTLTRRIVNGDEKDGEKNYNGPKLFVKPCHKSNKSIIENAVSHCCLAGTVNQDVKLKVLEALKKSDGKHFVVLFRDVGMQYRGLYTCDLETDVIIKVQGVGPKILSNKQIEKFYKYNSGSKNFSEVTSTKHMSATIDAITVFGAVWQKLKSANMAGSKKNLS